MKLKKIMVYQNINNNIQCINGFKLGMQKNHLLKKTKILREQIFFLLILK